MYGCDRERSIVRYPSLRKACQTNIKEMWKYEKNGFVKENKTQLHDRYCFVYGAVPAGPSHPVAINVENNCTSARVFSDGWLAYTQQ
jgi:hypothetical protein